MTKEFQALEDALKQYSLDATGSVYSIGVGDVLEYIETDLHRSHPDLFAQVAALDETSLALEIADAIGNIGILELVENAILETIRTQIAIQRESKVEKTTLF